MYTANKPAFAGTLHNTWILAVKMKIDREGVSTGAKNYTALHGSRAWTRHVDMSSECLA